MVLGGTKVSYHDMVALGATWQDGFGQLNLSTGYDHWLVAPGGASTITDLATGAVTRNATVTYFGLPVVGFSAQTFANGALPSPGGNVLSNYGALFNHRYMRRIEVRQ